MNSFIRQRLCNGQFHSCLLFSLKAHSVALEKFNAIGIRLWRCEKGDLCKLKHEWIDVSKENNNLTYGTHAEHKILGIKSKTFIILLFNIFLLKLHLYLIMLNGIQYHFSLVCSFYEIQPRKS